VRSRSAATEAPYRKLSWYQIGDLKRLCTKAGRSQVGTQPHAALSPQAFCLILSAHMHGWQCESLWDGKAGRAAGLSNPKHPRLAVLRACGVTARRAEQWARHARNMKDVNQSSATSREKLAPRKKLDALRGRGKPRVSHRASGLLHAAHRPALAPPSRLSKRRRSLATSAAEVSQAAGERGRRAHPMRPALESPYANAKPSAQ